MASIKAIDDGLAAAVATDQHASSQTSQRTQITRTSQTPPTTTKRKMKGYTTRYYRDNRERESQRRLENYYKNRYGVEPDKIEDFKKQQAALKAEKEKSQKAEQKVKREREKWDRLFEKMKNTPNPYQSFLAQIAPISNIG